jgi:hypothetical protein
MINEKSGLNVNNNPPAVEPLFIDRDFIQNGLDHVLRLYIIRFSFVV